MDSLEWQEVKFKGYLGNEFIFPALFNFSSCIQDDTIFVFGGMNSDYRCSKNLIALQLEDKRINYENPEESLKSFSELNKLDSITGGDSPNKLKSGQNSVVSASRR